MWWVIIVAIIGLLTILYVLLSKKNKYWIEKGIKQGSPVLVFGDKWRIVSHSESLSEMIQKLYILGEDDRYCGAYDFMSPALVLKDPELIKDILVKDFHHFVDHKRVIPKDSDPIWDKNLFFLEGQKWRDMRTTLSPAFTGNKLRYLIQIMSKSADQFVGYFCKQEAKTIDIEMKDTFARFTNDIIANAVFGFRSNSLEDKDSKFFEMAKRITDFSGFWQAVRIFGYFIVPKIYKIFNIRILSSEVANFFYNIVKENIRSRKNNKLISPDMINLLLEARENQKLIEGTEISDEDITAQALVFLFAGFDSVSSLMCFMAYELALNPDIQERLREEIDETRKSVGDHITYETINLMEHLDMVIKESLRKWPITPFVNRVCTEPYIIEAKKPNENPIHFELLNSVILPIYGLHRDPKYYPDPERFEPERFNEENSKNINPYVYMPFGTGPRKCIGYRFAVYETKILFYHLLSKFEIVVSGKTQIPVKICKKSINMTPETGLWVQLKRREK